MLGRHENIGHEVSVGRMCSLLAINRTITTLIAWTPVFKGAEQPLSGRLDSKAGVLEGMAGLFQEHGIFLMEKDMMTDIW